MDSMHSQPPSGGDTNTGGPGGYPSAGYGPEAGGAHRSLQDYLLILRERVWYIAVVFLVVFASAAAYTFSLTPVYEAVATVQLFRKDPTVMQVKAVVENEVRGAEDLNTQVKLMESGSIIEKVAERMQGEELRRFRAPYEPAGDEEPLTTENILLLNRKIVPQRLSLVLAVQYRHPDRQIAAQVANYFVDEFINYNNRVRIEESMKAVEDLKVRADEQSKKVESLANSLQAYRERHNMVSLDQRRDIVTEMLKALNANVTLASGRLQDIEVRWNQLQQRRREGKDFSDLPFIAAQPLIASLTEQISTKNIELAALQERYRERHPKMIEARNSLAQTEREMSSALAAAASQLDAEYDAARRSLTEARAALAAQEAESLNIDRFAVEYDAQEREYRINEQLLHNIISRMRETSLGGTLDNQNARIIDRAQPPLEDEYVVPNVPLNLGLGFVGGLGLGLAFAFFVAFLDDRVKSSFDIESVIGLPLVGIIPQIKKMEQPDKAQVAANNADRQVAEAFLSLHSALRLRDGSKKAQCILVTSTIPGEGKSFSTTNLALTFAAHGERVVIVDCDLRKPNIHRSFRLENVKGVIDVATGTGTIDDVVIRQVGPNLDVIPTGGRAKNPTQVLNSKGFERMLEDLRQRYDRVFIDTPPLAAVSDAMVVLPLVDGSLFTLYFNKVRRKAAQFAARKLLESNVPVFGAILNGLNLAVSGYYYAQYYDKSYKDYYVVMPDSDEAPAR